MMSEKIEHARQKIKQQEILVEKLSHGPLNSYEWNLETKILRQMKINFEELEREYINIKAKL